MDRYSIFDSNASAAASPAPAKETAESAVEQPVPSAPDDARKSLTEMADRELQAALQLLAERAQYIAGANGAMIALLENGQVICRASAGPAALPLGTQLQVEGGLTGESLRQKQFLRCDDADEDPLVNREGCRALGVRSVVVMPLVRDGEVAGVFELLADRPQAFEKRDEAALARLSELVLTALDHAEAARQALDGAVVSGEERLRSQLARPASRAAGETVPADPRAPERLIAAASGSEPSGKLAAAQQCKSCGFPVSPERTLCLDCEARVREEGSTRSAPAEAADFLSQLSGPVREEGWFDRNLYTVGTVVVAALTVLALWLKFH